MVEEVGITEFMNSQDRMNDLCDEVILICLLLLTRDLVPVASLPEKQRLRSAKSKDVVPNKHKLKSLGLRRFSVSGPKLWNNLPNSLKSSSSTKSFGRSLKTYLFNKSFTPSY